MHWSITRRSMRSCRFQEAGMRLEIDHLKSAGYAPAKKLLSLVASTIPIFSSVKTTSSLDDYTRLDGAAASWAENGEFIGFGGKSARKATWQNWYLSRSMTFAPLIRICSSI